MGARWKWAKKGYLMKLKSHFHGGQSVTVAASFLVTHNWYRSSGVFFFLFKLSVEYGIVVIAVIQPLYTCVVCLTVHLGDGVLWSC